jgi:hypothetical protein
MNEVTPRSKAKILADGGDPEETVRVRNLVGYVDGQTTNPTLVSRNPEVRTLISSRPQIQFARGVGGIQENCADNFTSGWQCWRFDRGVR